MEQVVEDKTIVEHIVGLASFLEAHGYDKAQSGVDDVISLASAIATSGSAISFSTADDIANILEPFFASEYSEHEEFRKLLRDYFDSKDDLIVSSADAFQIKRLMMGGATPEQARKDEEAAKRAARKAEKAKQAAEKAKTENTKPKLGSAAERKKLAEELKRVQNVIEEVSGRGNAKMFSDVPAMMERTKGLPQQSEMDKMRKALSKMMANMLSTPSGLELMDIVDKLDKALTKIEKASETEGKETKIAEEAEKAAKAAAKKSEHTKQQAEAIQEKIDEAMKTLSKSSVSHHRREFRGKNAVHCAADGEIDAKTLDKDIGSLTASEKQLIADYISDNARAFRTRVTRNVRSRSKRKLDMPLTVKKACSTNGVPMRLFYEKPKRNKAKIVMILDVSGSCKQVSSMALTFMYLMSEAFPGGCESYAFVNTLYDISRFFEDSDGDAEAVETVLCNIPTRGVYSDYCTPMRQFADDHISKVSSSTTVIFIGDARNNRNPSGEEYVKAIARKAKKAYWLNTDPIEKWDQGDSIISVYEPYMEKVNELTSVRQLLSFIETVR